MRGSGARVRGDAGGPSLPGLLDGRPGRGQWTLLGQVGVHAESQ